MNLPLAAKTTLVGRRNGEGRHVNAAGEDACVKFVEKTSDVPLHPPVGKPSADSRQGVQRRDVLSGNRAIGKPCYRETVPSGNCAIRKTRHPEVGPRVQSLRQISREPAPRRATRAMSDPGGDSVGRECRPLSVFPQPLADYPQGSHFARPRVRPTERARERPRR